MKSVEVVNVRVCVPRCVFLRLSACLSVCVRVYRPKRNLNILFCCCIFTLSCATSDLPRLRFCQLTDMIVRIANVYIVLYCVLVGL